MNEHDDIDDIDYIEDSRRATKLREALRMPAMGEPYVPQPETAVHAAVEQDARAFMTRAPSPTADLLSASGYVSQPIPEPETPTGRALDRMTDAFQDKCHECDRLRLEVEQLKLELETARAHQHTTSDEYRRKAQDLGADVDRLADMICECIGPSGSRSVLKMRFGIWEEGQR